MMRSALEQVVKVQNLHDPFKRQSSLFSWNPLEPIRQIGLNRQMWKQSRLLKDVPDGSLHGRQKDPSRFILPHDVAETDHASRRPLKAGHATKKRRFSAPGRTENGGHSLQGNVNRRVQMKRGVLHVESCRQGAHET